MKNQNKGKPKMREFQMQKGLMEVNECHKNQRFLGCQKSTIFEHIYSSSSLCPLSKLALKRSKAECLPRIGGTSLLSAIATFVVKVFPPTLICRECIKAMSIELGTTPFISTYLPLVMSPTIDSPMALGRIHTSAPVSTKTSRITVQVFNVLEYTRIFIRGRRILPNILLCPGVYGIEVMINTPTHQPWFAKLKQLPFWDTFCLVPQTWLLDLSHAKTFSHQQESHIRIELSCDYGSSLYLNMFRLPKQKKSPVSTSKHSKIQGIFGAQKRKAFLLYQKSVT